MNKIVRTGIAVLTLALCASFAAAQGGGQGQGRGQGRGGFGGQFGQRGGGGELQLVGRKDVQTDLAMTAEQVQKVADLNTKIREARRAQFQNGQGGNGGGGNGGQRGGFGQMTDEQRAAMQKQQEEQRAAQHKELAAILTEAQMTRLAEIGVQLAGNRAILQPDIQVKLGVTDEQKAKIKELQDKQREASASLMEKMRSQELTREELTATMTKNNEIFNTELGKIMTDDQRNKLKAMGGKPFKADPPRTGGGN